MLQFAAEYVVKNPPERRHPVWPPAAAPLVRHNLHGSGSRNTGAHIEKLNALCFLRPMHLRGCLNQRRCDRHSFAFGRRQQADARNGNHTIEILILHKCPQFAPIARVNPKFAQKLEGSAAPTQ